MGIKTYDVEVVLSVTKRVVLDDEEVARAANIEEAVYPVVCREIDPFNQAKRIAVGKIVPVEEKSI